MSDYESDAPKQWPAPTSRDLTCEEQAAYEWGWEQRDAQAAQENERLREALAEIAERAAHLARVALNRTLSESA